MERKRGVAELLRRYVFLCVALLIMAFGVAFSIKANLGTSPISSVPYVISLFAPLTVGVITILMHCVFITLQILILRKRYQPVQLMQLPVALVFGFMTDFAVWVLRDVHYSAYWQQWVLCAIGILLVAVGVSFEVTANVVVLAGEGLVLAVCTANPKLKFGNMKVAFDVSLVVIACLLSFLFLHHLAGVREGTVAAAILVGQIAKRINVVLKPFDEKVLSGVHSRT